MTDPFLALCACPCGTAGHLSFDAFPDNALVCPDCGARDLVCFGIPAGDDLDVGPMHLHEMALPHRPGTGGNDGCCASCCDAWRRELEAGLHPPANDRPRPHLVIKPPV